VHRTEDELKLLFPRYPETDDGYLESFSPDDSDKYLNYLNKYGFCIIKVLTIEQCDATIDELFNDINKRSPNDNNNKHKQKIDRHDPMTWETVNWPYEGKFLINTPAFGQCAFNNRTCDPMYKIWCNIFKETKLWCSIDKFGIFRGTVNLPFKDASENIELRERPEWRFNLKPHWDINPWVYSKELNNNEPRKYQGLVALDNCPVEVVFV